MTDKYFLPIGDALDRKGSLASREEAFSLLSEPLELVKYRRDFLSELDSHQFARIDDLGFVGGCLDDHLIFLFGGQSRAAGAVTGAIPYHLGLAWTEFTVNWSEPKNRRFPSFGSFEGSRLRFHYQGKLGSEATTEFLKKTIHHLNSKSYKGPSFLSRQ